MKGPAGPSLGGFDFESLARQFQAAWDPQRSAAAGNVAGNPGDWNKVMDWWAQLLPERGPGPADDAVNRFREQAGGWYGTMQKVASQFAGRDATSAEVAQAWRDAVMGQGKDDTLLQWMLQGAQGSAGTGGGMDDVVAVLQQWQERLAPWLQGPAFGPGREHQARWQKLMQAQQEFQDRSRDYVAQIRQALDAAFVMFEKRLAEHETPGSQLTSARAMFDLWIEAAEDAYAQVALSESFQQVFAALGNAQMRLRAAVQQEVEQLSERVGLPTRSEMDAAHRRIAELERQLRRLQASVATLERTAAPAGDSWAGAVQPAPAKVAARTRKRAAKQAAAPRAPAQAHAKTPVAAKKAGSRKPRA